MDPLLYFKYIYPFDYVTKSNIPTHNIYCTIIHLAPVCLILRPYVLPIPQASPSPSSCRPSSCRHYSQDVEQEMAIILITRKIYMYRYESSQLSVRFRFVVEPPGTTKDLVVRK